MKVVRAAWRSREPRDVGGFFSSIWIPKGPLSFAFTNSANVIAVVQAKRLLGSDGSFFLRGDFGVGTAERVDDVGDT